MAIKKKSQPVVNDERHFPFSTLWTALSSSQELLRAEIGSRYSQSMRATLKVLDEAAEWALGARLDIKGIASEVDLLGIRLLSEAGARDSPSDGSEERLFSQMFAFLVQHFSMAPKSESEVLRAAYWMEFWSGRWWLARQANIARKMDEKALSYLDALNEQRGRRIKASKIASNARSRDAQKRRNDHIEAARRLAPTYARRELVRVVWERKGRVVSMRMVRRWLSAAELISKDRK